MNILIVEDEELAGLELEWALKPAGHQILGPMDSVEQTIELTKMTRPDLALLDRHWLLICGLASRSMFSG